MSGIRTQPTESVNKRTYRQAQRIGGREVRAVRNPFRPLLELQPLYYGGEVTAG